MSTCVLFRFVLDWKKRVRKKKSKFLQQWPRWCWFQTGGKELECESIRAFSIKRRGVEVKTKDCKYKCWGSSPDSATSIFGLLPRLKNRIKEKKSMSLQQ